jgi:dihydrofolate synthase/folylpolyglutamate synthase
LLTPLSALAAPPAARYNTLAEWLTWQQQLHPHAVDLGLQRVTVMVQRLGLQRPADTVITVGGTNGKGSTVAFLESILRASGYRVGSYLSPHLLRYNERLRIAGQELSDTEWCDAFAEVDAARAGLSLTYFEFGTLAALWLMQRHRIEVALLEVGLGGRLDATNAIDSDCAVVTTIALDHCAWLGFDRDSIGYEKAGIFRSERPAICADPEPPARLLHHAAERGARLYCYGQDYHYACQDAAWDWQSMRRGYNRLPLPSLAGAHQLANAAAALMVLETLPLSVPEHAIRQGLTQAILPGRLQRRYTGSVEWIYDVAHNPQAAAALAAALGSSAGQTHLVLALLADKDSVAIIQALAVLQPIWYLAASEGERGQSGEQLAQQGVKAGITAVTQSFSGVVAACSAAAHAACSGDRIVVCGSFQTVASVWHNDFL